MSKITAQFDKVLMLRNEENKLVAIYVHDTKEGTRQAYGVDLYDMEQIQMLFNNGSALDVGTVHNNG